MSRLLVSVFALLVGGSCAGNIQPSKYTLQLLIDTEKDIFSGSLVIDAKVLAPTATNITLHSHGLNISSVSVTQQGNSSVYKSMAVSAEYQNVTISLTQNLNPNLNLKISLTYEGQVSTEEPTGLYTFMDSKKKFYITNLYPIHARKLFPCVDTPEAAAQMALTVIVTKANGNLTASTPITKVTSLSNGYTQYEVDTTIDIAPYSLFFTIGDWNSDSYTLPSPRSLLWLPPSLVSQIGKIDPNLLGALTTSYIPFVLEGFINHLNIFVVPALEDDTYSGLNTVVLRNDVLINNVGETTTEQHKEHLLKIAYAIWKMFWGTATRPAGWGNNWLTTSVPMYLAYSILDEPNWAATYGNSDENLVSGLYEKVFETCSDIGSPVSYMSAPPTNPRDILSFVRSSGIEKGVYALKTIETFVDPALIRSSLPTYIVQKNNSAIDTHSFLDMLAESTKSTVNLTQVILPILSQPGYPLVSVDRNAGTLDMLKANFVKVQTKSPTFGGQFSQLADAQSWLLPVTATTSQSPNSSKVYFLDAQAKVITGYFPSEGWALLNLDGKGIMRTSYDYTSWSILASASKTFSTATRAKLVADAFATAESNVQPSWTGTLKFLEVLDVETHLAPWKNALAGFKRMWSWIYYTGSPGNTNSTGQINLVDPFKAYVKARLTNLYSNLGPVGDNRDPQDFLRREIVAAMCDYGDSTCLQTLSAQYKNMNDGGSQPSNDLFSVVVCNGLRTADIDSWTKAFNKYAFGGVSYPKDQLRSHYNFLACSDSTDVIEKFLKTVLLNPQGNFPQEQIIPAVSEILDKPQHVDQVLNYFIEHQQTFNLSTGVQAELVMNIGKRLTSPTQTNLLAQFQKQHSQPSDINDAITKAIGAGNAKAQYILSIQGQVQSALRGEAPTTTSPSTGSSSGSSGTPPLTTPTTVPPPQTTTPGKASATAVSLLALMATAFALAAQ